MFVGHRLQLPTPSTNPVCQDLEAFFILTKLPTSSFTATVSPGKPGHQLIRCYSFTTPTQAMHINLITRGNWKAADLKSSFLLKQMVSAQMCPQGSTFHGGYCYTLSTERKLTWSEANRACRERYSCVFPQTLYALQTRWAWGASFPS